MSDSPSRPPANPPTTTLGTLCRKLRQSAGMTRRQLAEQTGLSIRTISNLETNRLLSTPAMVRQLLTSPALADLPALAKAAGLSLGLGDNGVSTP